MLSCVINKFITVLQYRKVKKIKLSIIKATALWAICVGKCGCIPILSLSHNLIVTIRTRFAPKVQLDGQWPKESKTMNLLESGLETELSLS